MWRARYSSFDFTVTLESIVKCTQILSLVRKRVGIYQPQIRTLHRDILVIHFKSLGQSQVLHWPYHLALVSLLASIWDMKRTSWLFSKKARCPSPPGIVWRPEHPSLAGRPTLPTTPSTEQLFGRRVCEPGGWVWEPGASQRRPRGSFLGIVNSSG